MYYIVICFVLFSLFRPRAPAAPQPELSSYCSTPPLKRKNKNFHFKTVPFVPTPAGLLSGAYFCRSGAAGGWNPRHSFLQAALLSAARFAGQPLLYRFVILHTQFRGRRWNPTVTAGGVDIGSTISVRCASRGKKNGCYRAHNSDFFLRAADCYPQHNLRGGAKVGYCYRQHISEFRLLSKRVRTGLLSSALFRQWGCYQAHSFQTVEFWRLLLSTAHF